MNISINIIGKIHSPYGDRLSAPRQGFLSEEKVKIEIFPEFAEGLHTLQPDQKIVVLYWADKADRNILQTKTPFGPEIKGVFATRSPARPNPINLCEAEITSIENNILFVKGLTH